MVKRWVKELLLFPYRFFETICWSAWLVIGWVLHGDDDDDC